MAKDASEPETVTAEFAWTWWKSLMANAAALVEDAALLASRDSAGRAQSFIVLAMEELAKARWLYEEVQYEWTAPLGPVRQGTTSARRRGHGARGPEIRTATSGRKLQMAEQFASGLAGFWHLKQRTDHYPRPELEADHYLRPELEAFEAITDEAD